MSHETDGDALAAQLAADYAGRVPPSLVRTAVDAVSSGPQGADPLDAERLARADVAALAAAIGRRSGSPTR